MLHKIHKIFQRELSLTQKFVSGIFYVYGLRIFLSCSILNRPRKELELQAPIIIEAVVRIFATSAFAIWLLSIRSSYRWNFISKSLSCFTICVINWKVKRDNADSDRAFCHVKSGFSWGLSSQVNFSPALLTWRSFPGRLRVLRKQTGE